MFTIIEGIQRDDNVVISEFDLTCNLTSTGT